MKEIREIGEGIVKFCSQMSSHGRDKDSRISRTRDASDIDFPKSGAVTQVLDSEKREAGMSG